MINNRLRELRQKRRLTLRELAEKTNLNNGNLSRMERGLLGIPSDTAVMLANFFGVTVGYILGSEEQTQPNIKSAKKIPIYSQIRVDHGGNILMQDEFIQDYLLVPESVDESDSVSITANDDSMKNSGIMSGDILLISKKGLVENNSIVAVAAIGGGAAVVRKHVILENKILLVSDWGIETKDNNHIILGKVIGFYRVF